MACSEMAQVRNDIALNLGSRPQFKNIDSIVAQMKKDLTGLTREQVVDAIVAANASAKRKAAIGIKKQLNQIKLLLEARTDKKLREKIDTLQKNFEERTLPVSERVARNEQTKVIQQLRSIRDDLQVKLRKSEPALRKRMELRLAKLGDIASGKVKVLPREKQIIPDQLQKLKSEIDKISNSIKDKKVLRDLKEKAKELEKHLSEGTLPVTQKRTQKEQSLAIAKAKQNIVDLKKQLRESEPALRKRMELRLAKLGDIASGKVKVLPREKQIIPDQLQKLKSEIDKISNSIKDKKVLRDLKEKAKELKKHLSEGTLPGKRTIRKEQSQAIANAQEDIVDLRKLLSESEPAQIEKLENQIEKLNNRLATGDISLPKRQVKTPQSKEVERLQFEKDKLRAEINDRINSLKPKSIWERVFEPAAVFRTLKTIWDQSALLRQGGIIVIGNPGRPFRAAPGAKGWDRLLTTTLVEGFRSMGSDRQLARAAKEMDSRINAPNYARDGLEFTKVGGKKTKQEEAFQTDFFERLAQKGKFGKVAAEVVLAWNRAFVTTLNRLRADSHDVMSATLSKTGDPTFIEGQAIANGINIFTGRGSLGTGKLGLERAATTLNTHFFAPKLVASRFQFVFLNPVLGKKGGTLRTRKLLAKETAKFYIGASTILFLASIRDDIEEIEFNPQSSDWLAIKMGNTRIDVGAGLRQVAVFTSRFATGKTKSLRTGEVKETARLRLAGRFARTKLAPFTGTVVDVLDRPKKSERGGTGIDKVIGKNVVGEPVTIKSAAVNLVTPLAPEEIADAMVELGVERGTAVGTAIFFGVGAQTFDVNERKKKKSAEIAAKRKRLEEAKSRIKGGPNLKSMKNELGILQRKSAPTREEKIKIRRLKAKIRKEDIALGIKKRRAANKAKIRSNRKLVR